MPDMRIPAGAVAVIGPNGRRINMKVEAVDVDPKAGEVSYTLIQVGWARFHRKRRRKSMKGK